MRLFFLLINLLVLALCPLYANADEHIFPKYEGERCEYTVEFGYRDVSVTGISILKLDNGCILGTVVNEFGIKIFDFTVGSDRRVKLMNVISYMDKWYIKRVIKSDLKYLFSYVYDAPYEKRGKKVTAVPNCIGLKNSRRGITYRFCTIDNSCKNEID